MRRSIPLFLLAGLLLTSCIAPTLYHDQPRVCAVPSSETEPEGACSRAAIEDHDEYLLAFVEFDDLGWAWERKQGEVLLRALLGKDEMGLRDQDLLMVVFVHGWRNNAHPCNNNVACFRATLKALHDTEVKLAAGRRKERRVVGIFVGWRGDSKRGRLLAQTTFYGRKRTAHQVGSGAVTELLLRLAEVRREKRATIENSSTRLVIVGHSFGGALVYSATSQLMMERLVTADQRGGTVRGLGDLVVLVNPAFEAARYEPLHEAVNEKTMEIDEDQQPVFAIFTSQGDTATSRAFPLGRTLSVKHYDYRTDTQQRTQKEANRKAVGHFEPYRTHFLETHKDTPVPEGPSRRDEECRCPFTSAGTGLLVERADAGVLESLQKERKEFGGKRLTFPTARLVYEEGEGTQNKDKRTPYSAVQVIAVDDQIITGHSDIYRPAFIDFLRYYIMLATESRTESEVEAEGAPAG